MEIGFDKLPLGDVPRRNDPLGEFHCIRSDPRYAGWHEPTLHWTWRSSNWRVGEEGGTTDHGPRTTDHGLRTADRKRGRAAVRRRFIEQLHESRYNNTLIVTDADFGRVRGVEVQVFCPRLTQEVGLVFCFRTALDYMALVLDPGGVKFVSRNGEQFHIEEEMAGTFKSLVGDWVTLRVTLERMRLSCWVEDEEAFSVRWGGHLEGKVGLLANCPARFRALAVDGRPARRKFVVRALARDAGQRPEGRTTNNARYPKMQLVRKIPTPGFGTCRQMRFGDLTGDGRPDIVLAQRAPIEGGEGYYSVGCLTALTAEGEVLWQSGTPTPQTPLAGDLPFQVNDIDGDGRAEVVAVRGFQIQVLDGATGRLKFSAPTPERPEHHPLLKRSVSYFGSPDGHEFSRVVADSIRFADLAGRGAARDLLLKDRYHHLWALSPDLKPLWAWVGNLGHFPFAADLDGDGRDEVIAGYHWLTPDGRDLQNLHLGDHADAIFAGDIQAWGEPKAVRAGGDDGLIIAGLHGDLLAVHLGHVQRLSIAKFRREAPGLQYVICTYWGAPGIVALLDSTGKVVWTGEAPVCGNTLQPVNWTGRGEELIYFSAHPDHGGLYDWQGKQVVPFPSDGHPELCSEVLDLLGSGRDNLIVWDPSQLWLYAPAGDAEVRHRPRRPPLHSWSNYMCYWSLPER
ncbi:MAG: hypothetical protein FJ290_28070 [Planctomycetes bacterium]|nr:hypothetical protein [Planctomycetota bacterium]